MLNISDKHYFQRTRKWFVFAMIILIISFILSSIFSPSLDTFKNMGDQIPSSLDKATGLNKVWEFIIFDFHKGLIIIVSSIPHIIIEILAMCFVVSSLYKLNQAIVRKISNLFRKEKRQNVSFKQALIQLIKTYILIALPLYIIAAFLETYFTEWIYSILI